MPFKERLTHIVAELKGHAPFTILGATIGVVFMLMFINMPKSGAHTLFSIFHPAHVFLSAIVTASMFVMHKSVKNFLIVLIVGYIGSIGIATLSDSVMPFIGEKLMGLDIPTHADTHKIGEDTETHHDEHDEHETAASDPHHGHHDCDHGNGLHIGFIEEALYVNLAAILGVLVAWFLPRTKFPHAAHVLLSTWASSAHIMMNTHAEITAGVITGIFAVLFLAVWLPCCVSDIIFPLLFVESDIKIKSACPCSNHSHHSHPHEKVEE